MGASSLAIFFILITLLNPAKSTPDDDGNILDRRIRLDFNRYDQASKNGLKRKQAIEVKSGDNISNKPNQKIISSNEKNEIDYKKLVDKMFVMPNLEMSTDTKIGTVQSTSNVQMDKLIYDMVQNREEKEIENHFETSVLRTMQLKTKLDKKIDELGLMLQVLENLRDHIDSALTLAKKVVHTTGANYDTKQYVLSQLDSYNKQIEKNIHFNQTKQF